MIGRSFCIYIVYIGIYILYIYIYIWIGYIIQINSNYGWIEMLDSNSRLFGKQAKRLQKKAEHDQ